MGMKVLILVVVLCAVVNSDEYGRSRQMPEYLRVKRAKYYSSPSRFYRKPPPPFLTKGAFSYTPPPNYMESDDPHPGSFRPKVSTSKRPVNDGLGDDDINNLVKHLSKQDLDRIIEFAGEKYGNPIEKYSTSLNKVKENDDVRIYKVAAQETDQDHQFALNGLYIGNNEHTGYEMEYKSISKRPADTDKYVNNANQFAINGLYANVNNANFRNTPPQFHPSPEINSQELANTPLDTQESKHSGQFTMLDAYIQKELNGAASDKVVASFTDSQATQEEQLPKPVNLREDHYETSNTDNVEVVKQSSYKLENFGNLPLMDYSSKRDTVSSYHVPHYSVVSSPNNAPPPPAPASYGPSSNIKTPPIEPAPPVSAAKEQSDAHLKAIKIWTHRSKGAAYTLHDDGSLSVETPGRPKPAYGYS
ncbi:uncharacterized protein LOC114350351 [Ostrinia furnacalis]|uniref:uncharacterized protein LOC114350351 n=1 Tax=Ostrinia furnacalis TaxID=93504 RepID=UPI00103BE2DE|nr:uncharacterized protein LOC114350351 [Ostrinia furnacalis]